MSTELTFVTGQAGYLGTFKEPFGYIFTADGEETYPYISAVAKLDGGTDAMPTSIFNAPPENGEPCTLKLSEEIWSTLAIGTHFIDIEVTLSAVPAGETGASVIETLRFSFLKSVSSYGTVITNIGQAKIAQAVANAMSLNITMAVVGDGNGEYYYPSPEQTALRNTRWQGEIASKAVVDNDVQIGIVLGPAIGNFTCREIGLLDEDGDLIAIGNFQATDKVSSAYGTSTTLRLMMHIYLVDASVLTVNINTVLDGVYQEQLDEVIEQALITIQDNLDDHNADPLAHPAIRQTIDNHKTDANAHPDIRTVISNHVSNTANPHNISLEQLGIAYGVSASSASPFGATVEGFALKTGGLVSISFTDAVGDGTSTTYLNVNSTGDKRIIFNGGSLGANDTGLFVYDGTHYVLLNKKQTNLANVTGILPIANGGTGRSTDGTHIQSDTTNGVKHGSVLLPGGVLIMWGKIASSGSTTYEHSFTQYNDNSFADNNYVLTLGVKVNDVVWGSVSKSTTGFSVDVGGIAGATYVADWIAIGMGA